MSSIFFFSLERVRKIKRFDGRKGGRKMFEWGKLTEAQRGILISRNIDEEQWSSFGVVEKKKELGQLGPLEEVGASRPEVVAKKGLFGGLVEKLQNLDPTSLGAPSRRWLVGVGVVSLVIVAVAMILLGTGVLKFRATPGSDEWRPAVTTKVAPTPWITGTVVVPTPVTTPSATHKKSSTKTPEPKPTVELPTAPLDLTSTKGIGQTTQVLILFAICFVLAGWLEARGRGDGADWLVIPMSVVMVLFPWFFEPDPTTYAVWSTAFVGGWVVWVVAQVKSRKMDWTPAGTACTTVGVTMAVTGRMGIFGSIPAFVSKDLIPFVSVVPVKAVLEQLKVDVIPPALIAYAFLIAGGAFLVRESFKTGWPTLLSLVVGPVFLLLRIVASEAVPLWAAILIVAVITLLSNIAAGSLSARERSWGDPFDTVLLALSSLFLTVLLYGSV